MSLIALLNVGFAISAGREALRGSGESYYRLSAPANSSSNDVFSFAAIA
jgi:hypothetical protein